MFQPKPIRGFAPVNGQRIYYEMHGAGEPLVLVHGEFGAGDDFARLLPTLSRGRQVVLLDMQGHGRTADIDRPLCFELLADDVAALIRHLGFEAADVAGFSLGGCVALQAAIRNVRAIRRAIVISAPFRGDGWRAPFGAAMAGEAAHEVGSRDPAGRATLVAKTRTLLTYPFDWSAELTRIEAPTLVVTAETDRVLQDHADRLARDLASQGGAHRVTLPGTTADTILSSPALADALLRFLDEPVRTNR